MERSNTIASLAKALSLAQPQFKPAIKDASNPFFNSKYADLSSVWDACREALGANGLSVVQLPAPAPEGHVALTTVLMHASGEFLSETFSLKLVKPDPQSAGSALSYARRYCLAALLGIVSDDDDGNAASGRTQSQKPADDVPVTFDVQGWVVSGEKRTTAQGKKLWDIGIQDDETDEVHVASTFSSTVAKQCSAAKAQGEQVLATLERKGRFLSLVALKVFATTPGDDE